MSAKGEIILNFDRKTREYYIIWEPVVIAMGKTRRDALKDLRTAAHSGIDTLIDMKSKVINEEKEG